MTRLNGPVPGVPLPHPSSLSAPFWDGCTRGELRFQRCRECDKAVFPPEAACTRCLSPELAWERSAGLGDVISYTVLWHAPQPVFTTPYAVAIARMDEGHCVLANVVDLDSDDLAVGLRVRADYVDVGDDITLPVFRRVSSGTSS
jgi:uncharacterized protein